jgi:hypothetical protein
MLRTTFRFTMLAAAVATPVLAAAQVPVPFPRPGQPPVSAPQTPPIAPPDAPATPATQPAAGGDPNEATLGVPLYPGSQFIASYDAGRGQRYYLFGVMADYAQIVGYYRSMLKTRGEEVFEQPPVHMFDIGRFREETMAFPPSVTVKDYTWGGSLGYLNPKRGAEPARFKTIIQVVPVQPGAAR